MTQPSTVDRLPEQIRVKIAQLRDQGATLDEILEHLGTLDVAISRSALGRHVKKMAKVTDDIRRSRQMAEAVARTFGDKETSQVAKTNIEILHSIMLKTMIGSDDEDAEVLLDAKEAMFLATALEKLSKASKTDFDKQLVVAREQERTSALNKAADAVDTVGKQAGLTTQTVEAIKKQILGVG